MILKTITTDSVTGQAKERWYELTQTTEAIQRRKINLGRGVKANYWQFTLANKLGADFELDMLEFLPVVLTRKV